MGNISLLRCAKCSAEIPASASKAACSCRVPLLADYDFAELRKTWHVEDLLDAQDTLWRYEPVLPAPAREAVTLGEGSTPLRRAIALGNLLKAHDLWIKDESLNPTSSDQARGVSVALTVSRKREVRSIVAVAPGDAGTALAAYSAAAGIRCRILMPKDLAHSNLIECRAYGAEIELRDRWLESRRTVSDGSAEHEVLDVSSFREPFRIEGQKTAGYEIAEQFGWESPDAILCPCGDGLALTAVWKAFGELNQLGWMGSKYPKMIGVQSSGCAPIVRALERKAEECEVWPNPYSIASEMRIANVTGGFLVLKAIRDSGGTAIAVPDEDMLDEALLLARAEGIFAPPDTGACIAAARRLLATGFLNPSERIVIYNVAAGSKRFEAFSSRFVRRGSGEQDKLGGLILPR